MKFSIKPHRVAIMAEGGLDANNGKTAAGVIRYSPHTIVGIVDSENAGRDCAELLGCGHGIPIVAKLDGLMEQSPQALLLGTAPRGGALPPEWRGAIKQAMSAGLDIWSGLHTMLGEDPEFSALARESGATIIDYRKHPEHLPVGAARCRRMKETIVLTVGTDCSVGKMTASLEIAKGIDAAGLTAAFVATGQTGMMIAGSGYPIDAIKGDFMAGAVEKSVLEWEGKADVIMVEGQGSLLHPGYSGVTLALLHGAAPGALILCHDLGISELKRDYGVAIPPLSKVAAQFEELARYVRPAQTIAIALRTRSLSEPDSIEALKRIERETGVPADDPVRFGPAKLAEAVVAFHKRSR